MNFRTLHTFQQPELLEVALTHKSKAFETRQASDSATHLEYNEKLEFLGDAVIGLVLADQLMLRFGHEAEGGLSKRRAALVNEEKLAELARQIGLDSAIYLGKGELKTGGGNKPRILACAFEAWVGAVFRDSGFTVASKVVSEVFEKSMQELELAESDYVDDFKTRLQERTQVLLSVQPRYRLVEETGPAHERMFCVEVLIEGHQKGTDDSKEWVSLTAQGVGRSKKTAEQAAARVAFQSLERSFLNSESINRSGSDLVAQSGSGIIEDKK